MFLYKSYKVWKILWIDCFKSNAHDIHLKHFFPFGRIARATAGCRFQLYLKKYEPVWK